MGCGQQINLHPGSLTGTCGKFACIEREHAELAKVRIRATCPYCEKDYTYSALLGDIMHACNKSRCIVQAMRNAV
jgi:hypothetical protein